MKGGRTGRKTKIINKDPLEAYGIFSFELKIK